MSDLTYETRNYTFTADDLTIDNACHAARILTQVEELGRDSLNSEDSDLYEWASDFEIAVNRIGDGMVEGGYMDSYREDAYQNLAHELKEFANKVVAELPATPKAEPNRKGFRRFARSEARKINGTWELSYGSYIIKDEAGAVVKTLTYADWAQA